MRRCCQAPEVIAMMAASAFVVSTIETRAADFYARKSINLYIGFDVAGGYDLYARLIARHIARHIPGNPNVIPQNMPGAAGLKVANYLFQVAPQDGTALAMSAEAVALEQVLGGVGIDYDASRFSWVGRISPSASVTFNWHTSPVKTIEDARGHESALGASGFTGITSYTPRALNKLAGTKFKLVTGYTGSSSVLLAMERNEIDGGFALWPEFKQQKPDWLSEKKINILFIVAANRAPDLADVPTTGELGSTSEARATLRFLASTTEIGRSIFSTPNVPTERLALLRRGFLNMIGDTEFKQDAARSGLRINPMSGENLQKLVADVVGSPRSLVENAKAARN